MLSRRLLLSVSALILVTLPMTGCIRQCCARVTPQPATAAVNEIYQEFPSRGTAETAWRVRWAQESRRGLYITGAWFRRTPTESWIRILWDARLSELFVPYHSGSPRFYDLSGFNFGLIPVSQADAGCCGRLLRDLRPGHTTASPVVVKEVRDRGILWKDDAAGRRGEEMLLWGVLDAGNYNYIMQYGFRDDGTITFRLGGTGENLPGARTEAHMHHGLWRVDIDLAGFPNDSAVLVSHNEPVGSPSATDVAVPFNGGVEGFADWEDLEFTELRVVDTRVRNAIEHKISYDFMPLRRGTARHYGPGEDFTHHDFWVTRYRGTELMYKDITTYVANQESVLDTDVVVWVSTPVHHLPRDEDGNAMSGSWNGVALLMWGGFDLRPRNLFADTPLHP